jgi:hypothetical protein
MLQWHMDFQTPFWRWFKTSCFSFEIVGQIVEKKEVISRLPIACNVISETGSKDSLTAFEKLMDRFWTWIKIDD